MSSLLLGAYYARLSPFVLSQDVDGETDRRPSWAAVRALLLFRVFFQLPTEIIFTRRVANQVTCRKSFQEHLVPKLFHAKPRLRSERG